MDEYGLEAGCWPGGANESRRETGSVTARRRCYRSIWISDLHLGTRRCQARELVEFLDQHEAENLYLVGDIVDGWVMGPSWHWDREQGAVTEKITSWHRRGVRIIFLPGNHDEFSTDLAQALLGPIPIVPELVHRTADGRRMLVIHGHQFDGSLNPNRWLYILGPQAYHRALRIDRWYNEEQTRAHQREARLGSYLKKRMSRAVRYLTDFGDRAVLETARRHGADGVICGHTHLPEIRPIGPITYINDGDWVRSCTALVEETDGTLRLLHRDGDRGGWSERESAAEEEAPS
jgi:UDP-2,3-diacylglucosamine pyrophosphatase LpxH